MQEVLDARDKLRLEVEDLDGGYVTVAKILNVSKVTVFNSLSESNVPRIATLEKIRVAVNKASIEQKVRLAQL